jgi:endo-1,3-1,4-beta-glycanase ExoK
MTLKSLRLPLLVAPLAAACAQIAGAQPVGPEPFVERFVSLDEGFWLVSDGWSNGDWTANDWRRGQVATSPRDGLTLTMAPSSGEEKPYSSGEIRTLSRYHHGYFEIDMRAARGSGVVSGFFTYTGAPFDDPHDEIDIEILGRNTEEVTLTVFTDDVQNSIVLPLGFDAAEDFHLYAFEWTEDYVRWYVDGALKHEVRQEDFALPTTPQIYYLDLWGSEVLTDWVGRINPEDAPWTLHVACMAYAGSYSGETLCREP